MAVNIDKNPYASYSSGYNSYIGNSSPSGSKSIGSLNQILKLNAVKNSSKAKTSAFGSIIASNIKQYASALNSTVKDLLNGPKSIFKKTTAVADNKTAFTLKTDENNPPKNRFSASLDIKQVAAAQQNTGRQLDPAAKYSGLAGQNHFALSVGGKSYNISVNVKSNDTNKAVLQKTADAVNNKNIGVTASITYDSKTQKSSLVLESKKTGENNGFLINDVPGNGRIVSSLGADYVSQTAKNAIYKVNEKDYTESQSNEVDLGGVTAYLKHTTDKPSKIYMAKDEDSIAGKVNSFVKNYNNLLAFVEGNSSGKAMNKLHSDILSAAKSYSPSLSRIGLNVTSDGFISVESDKLNKSIENGTAGRILSSNNIFTGGGFTAKISRISSDAYRNSNRFARDTYNLQNYSSNSAEDSGIQSLIQSSGIFSASGISSVTEQYYGYINSIGNNKANSSTGSLIDIIL